LGYHAYLGVALAISDDTPACLIDERDCDIGSTDWIIIIVNDVNCCWVGLKGNCFCRRSAGQVEGLS